MQFFTDTLERWQTANFSLGDIIVFIVLGLGAYCIYIWHSEGNAEAEKEMDERNFVMRKHKIETWLSLILFPILGAILFYWGLAARIGVAIPVSILMFLGGIGNGIDRLSWEVRIDGNEIHYKSLLWRKTILFHEIRSVKPRYYFARLHRSEIKKIRLYSDTKKLFSIERQARGYIVFVNRLKEYNVAGAEAIYAQRKNVTGAAAAGHWEKEDIQKNKQEKPVLKKIKAIKKPREPIPKFKYHLYPLDTFGLEQDRNPVVCECCNRETRVYYNSPYYPENTDLEYLCPHCIADGSASKKFRVTFQDLALCDGLEDKEKLEELCTRTPGYISPRQAYWLAHCNDFCTLLADISNWDQLKAYGLEAEVETDWVANREIRVKDVRNIKKHLTLNGKYNGYLFRCLHCGKHRLYVDQKEA